MAESTQEKKSSKKLVVILLVLLLILILGILLVLLVPKGSEEKVQPADETAPPGFQIQYDEAVVVLDEEAMRKAMEAGIAAAKDNIIVDYQKQAYSVDGVNFDCVLNNHPSQEKDVYFNVYLDESYEKQVLLTGLVPPGSGIRQFKSEIEFEAGVYDTVLVITTVGDDHATITGQAKVTYQLVVG